MAARLPADLLRRTADEGPRLVALAYLDETEAAQQRLTVPEDSEALHDFRVGIRRLRSCLRAYRPQLKNSVSKKLRRRLGEITTATNPIRDAEVLLAWLHQQTQILQPDETEGLAWLIGRLDGRRYEAQDRVMQITSKEFSKLAVKLRRRLQTFRVEVRTGRQPRPISFGQVNVELILRHATELRGTIDQIVGAEDMVEIHSARIEAKRLRYLLEPLSRRITGAKELVGRLKELQDLLGHLHDMQLLGQEIAASLSALSSDNTDRSGGPLPGLHALQGLAANEGSTTFQAYLERWAGGRADRFFFSRARVLAGNLEQTGSGPVTPPLRPQARSPEPHVVEEGHEPGVEPALILSPVESPSHSGSALVEPAT